MMYIDEEASGTYVTFSKDTDEAKNLVSASRGVVEDALRRLEKNDNETELIQDYRLDWDDLKALVQYMNLKSQIEYDVALEKRIDRAEQFDSNWE